MRARMSGGVSTRGSGKARARAGGFSLIELLVTIGIIAVLVALALPALSRSKKRADDIELLANQRESLLVLCTYAYEHDGDFPSFGVEETMIAPMEWRGETLHFDWWDQMDYWGLWLQEKGYDGWVTLGPGAVATTFDKVTCGGCGQGQSLHVLTAAALADAAFFVDGAEDDRLLHKAQSIDAVTYPAQKGLVVNRMFSPQGYDVGFADGHVERVPKALLTPGADCDIPYAPLPVVTTRDGVRGRDR